jgi:anthranilate/para-aminobenzoate synthase component I
MRSILSCSPELFFAVDNGVVAARPTQGTAPRGADKQDDARICGPEGERQGSRRKSDDLDLIRNDIGGVAKIGHRRGQQPLCD